MEKSPPSEDTLLNSIGMALQSSYCEGVTYYLGRRVGEGGMAVAYLALRVGPDGQTPVVLKILRPSFVRRFGDTALLTVKKESVALGRLNERVPPTPFVVRLIEVGSTNTLVNKVSVELPWLAVEYVHGGAEGTTLSNRVAHSLRQTGHSFGPDRAAHAIDCLCKGLAAVHDVGVIHRDLKPENVLCCGAGQDEIFKVADFGVACPSGVAATFGGSSVGTPGYAAPELIIMDQKQVGVPSDVFGMAAVIYFMFTARPYFKSRTVADAAVEIMDPKRSSLLDEATLSLELRQRESACRRIDHILARATAIDPRDRFQSADALAAALLPCLRTKSPLVDSSPRSTHRIVTSNGVSGGLPLGPQIGMPLGASMGPQIGPPIDVIASPDSSDEIARDTVPPAPRTSSGLSWIVRRQADPERIIRSVAWTSDGRCLAATNTGVCFWDGTDWVNVPVDYLDDPKLVRFVHRMPSRRWLVGADDAVFAILGEDGPEEVIRLSNAHVRVEAFNGSFGDLCVLVALGKNGVPTLHTLVGRRWLKPLPLADVLSLTSIARVGDSAWLLAGRKRGGGGIAAIFRPLLWELQPIESPNVRAYLSCGGHAENGIGVVGGADGVVLYLDETEARVESVPSSVDVSATVVDPSGTCWCAGAGHIWQRMRNDSTGHISWACVWHDASWTSPMVSMLADDGLVLAVTADGAIVEGRSANLALSAISSIAR